MCGRIENADIASNIITCLEKNGELKMMSDFIRTDRLRMNDVVNGHDLIQLCVNPYSGILFCEDTIKRFSREKDSGGVKVGEYEYLLRMFLNNVDIKDHRGDIVSDGKTLELKCGSARISGSKTNSPSKIREKLNALLKANYNTDEFNNGSIRQTPTFFESISHIGSDTLAEVMVESYLASYESIPLIYKEKLMDFVESRLVPFDKDSINALIVLICLVGYRFSEDPGKGFDYFMIIDKKTGEYKCFDMNDDNLFEKFYNSVMNGQIKVLSLPNEKDTMYGKGPRICFDSR